MMSGIEPMRAEIEAIVGGGSVVSDDAVCRTLSADGCVPKSVVYPRTAEQVAAVLKCAADHTLAVIPCRNATKLGLGNIPARYDVALSLRKMNNVWHYEPEDLTATVEAGMKLGELARLLGRNGLWLPLDPPGGARASVGGVLATNASGPLRLLYGAPRDMIVGMTIATTDGKIIKAGGRVVKNVAGYDLTKLLIGSHGALGVMVEAHLKLFPLPAGRATFIFHVASLDEARDLRKRILQSPLNPMRMTLLNAEAGKVVWEDEAGARPGSTMTLWVEAGGTNRVLERYARTLGAIGSAAGAKVSTMEQGTAERSWARMVDFQSWLAEEFSDAVILRGSLPIAGCEEFVNRAQQGADKTKSRLAVFAQPGVGTAHLCYLDPSDYSAIVSTIDNLRAAAKELHGALLVERCAPEIKQRLDVWGAPGNDFEVMRKVKHAWDPKGILSPGRFVGRL
ncbi:MAG TPA: FAD-binding oxidoreductase [Terriglobia bacterium]|nr:FAD-binding oxidoreductase [Terriglobia bacterium]